jgi:hypothetical protein
MDSLDGAPREASKHNTVLTYGYDEVNLMEDSYEILNMLATSPEWEDVVVAYVSRTDEVSWAKKCLKLLKVTDSMTMDQLGTKQVHSNSSVFSSLQASFFINVFQNAVDCLIVC